MGGWMKKMSLVAAVVFLCFWDPATCHAETATVQNVETEYNFDGATGTLYFWGSVWYVGKPGWDTAR